MAKYTAKKFAFHFAICLIVYLLIRAFAPLGSVYAGWAAGFLGACYLLAGWFSYLKSKGTDFTKLLRRKKQPETPYYLRGTEKQRKTRLGWGFNRHDFSDDLDDAAEENANTFPPNVQCRLHAIAWVLNGAILLALSAF